MRRLIFTVPSGDETHYWKIKGGKEETVGKVWAPLFHAYSYYLPKAKVPQRLWKRVDDNLTAASIGNLKHALMNMMFLAPMGPNRMIMNLLGSVGFAELESGFAYLDGNVSFGSSHTMGHTWGFGLVSLVLMLWRSSIRKNRWVYLLLLPFITNAIAGAGAFYYQWHLDGYQITNLQPFTPDYEGGKGWLHRIDHMAHIGGLIAGGLTAFFTRNMQLVRRGTWVMALPRALWPYSWHCTSRLERSLPRLPNVKGLGAKPPRGDQPIINIKPFLNSNLKWEKLYCLTLY